ncbi:MAG: cupin domain-containing protein [Candidatus Acidiferrales bacterium]
MRARIRMATGSAALLGAALLAMNAFAPGAQHGDAVEMHGVKAAVKQEANVEGFLTPLNSHLKLRATEADFEPGATLGDHLHVGPGLRLVLAGELVVVDAESGAEQRVPAGGYFYEAGDKSFRVHNRSEEPARLLVVEILPVDLKESAMTPVARRGELEKLGAKLEAELCRAK